MIVKMKFLSISGPKNDIDRVCEVCLLYTSDAADE